MSLVPSESPTNPSATGDRTWETAQENSNDQLRGMTWNDPSVTSATLVATGALLVVTKKLLELI